MLARTNVALTVALAGVLTAPACGSARQDTAPAAPPTASSTLPTAAHQAPQVSGSPLSHESPDAFVDVADVAPGVVVDMRYFGANNFVGRRIDGYEEPVCLLTREAAAAVAAVQTRLQPFGFGLKVFDCYRPARAVAHFVRWARDPADLARQADFYPEIDKSRLFELGYIAERSGHSRGSTVDLTIVDARTGAELDMGTGWDLFSTRSWPADTTMTAPQRANRLLLQSVMVAHGFRPYDQEWWHFTLRDEPFPDTYFDFVVRRPRAGASAPAPHRPAPFPP